MFEKLKQSDYSLASNSGLMTYILLTGFGCEEEYLPGFKLRILLTVMIIFSTLVICELRENIKYFPFQ